MNQRSTPPHPQTAPIVPAPGSRLRAPWRVGTLSLLFLLAASSAAVAGELTARASVVDGSTPPPGLTWNAYCFFAPPTPPAGTGWLWATRTAGFEPFWWGWPCGTDLPLGQEVVLSHPEARVPSYVSGERLRTADHVVYYSTAISDTYPTPGDNSIRADLRFEAAYGSIHGYVRLFDDTPVEGVTVFARGDIQGGSATALFQATTDAQGHYDFTGSDPLSQLNHWGIGVGWHRLTAQLLGDGSLSNHDLVKETMVQSSRLSRVDFVLPRPEKGEDPEEPSNEDQPEAPTGGQPGGTCSATPPEGMGKPVSLLTGSVYFDQTDAVLPGRRRLLVFSRNYNSKRAYNNKGGAFGPGWTHSLEKRITVVSGPLIRLNKGDSAPVYFHDQDGDLTYRPSIPSTERSWIVKSGDTYTRYFQQGGAETYDAAGLLISQADRVGNPTTLGHDASGNLTSITAPGGRTFNLTYDSSRVASLSGPDGLIATYAYTTPGPGLLQTVTYADGSGYTFTYDDSGQVLTMADMSGKIIETHTYSGDMALTSEIADGREKYTFSNSNGLVVDALGRISTYTLTRPTGGTMNKVGQVTGPCDGGGGGNTTRNWTYDSDGRIQAFQDGKGQTTTYTYDASGNPLTLTDPLGRTTTYTNDSLGRILTRTGPDGAVTTATYGPAGPLTVRDPEGRTTTISYDTAGLPVSITDPRGKAVTLAYNSFGDLVSVTDPLENRTSFGYDAMGRPTDLTDPLSHSTATTYDARGRVTRVTNSDGTHVDIAYDLGGRRTSITDPLGRTARYTYDPYGRVVGVQDAADGITRYDYDLMSQLSALSDAKGQTTRFEYDRSNRLKAKTYPGGGSETFTYDDAGRLRTTTDRRGVVTAYTYDITGRLTRQFYSDKTPAVTYTYNEAGRLRTVANGTDALTWTYDLAGRLLSEQSSRNGSVVAYTSDQAGNRLTLNLDGAPFTSYGYDDASRLTTITRGASVFGFAYDGGSRRTSMTHPNGIATSYNYDPLNRLADLGAVLNGTTAITSFGYTYDNAGNRLSKATLEHSEAYAYDPLYRLTTVERSGSQTGHWRYDYDAVGNRTSNQFDNAITTAAHNEQNQLLSASGGGPLRVRGVLDEAGTVRVNGQPAALLAGNNFEATISAAPGTNTFTVEATDFSGNIASKTFEVEVSGAGASYTYDSNGNLTSKTEGTDTWTYTWNALNQLMSASKNGVPQATFQYDPLGRRVLKSSPTKVTSYTYDGADILRESVTAGGITTTSYYVHGPSIDEPLAKETGGVVTYYHADGLGSIVKETSAAGAVTNTLRYDAWGNIEAGARDGFAFTGREWDPETGLYSYRARYYDPAVARFVSEDPIGFAGGQVNLFAYAHNGPTMYRDPSGNFVGALVLAPVNPILMGVATTAFVYWGAYKIGEGIADMLFPPYAGEHTKGKRPSTREDHEEGDARRKKDRGGEKGDERRRPPRKPPDDNWRGPWPPKDGRPWWGLAPFWPEDPEDDKDAPCRPGGGK